MNVRRLRKIMRRYKEVGVLLVGAYLVGRHLWTRRRAALLATLLVAGCWLGRESEAPSRSPLPPVPPPPVRPVELPSDYMPQKRLLPHANPVTALDAYYCTHFWISDDRLMLVTGAEPTRIYDCLDVFPSAWKGKATLLDLHSGHRRLLKGLTRIFQRMHGMPGGFETSPGGKWLHWTNWETGDGWPFPMVAHWDGSECQRWSEDRASETYWLDDHRWIEEEHYPYYPKDVIVRDADRHTMSVLKLRSRAGQTLVAPHYLHVEPRFETAWEPATAIGPKVTITVKSGDDDTDAAAMGHTYTIQMPCGADVRQVSVAPKTHRVLYVLQFRQCADATRPPSEFGACGIWTSNLDGSGFKELGYVENGQPYYEASREEKDPAVARNMFGIQWLKDGRHFEFIYDGKLYRAAGY